MCLFAVMHPCKQDLVAITGPSPALALRSLLEVDEDVDGVGHFVHLEQVAFHRVVNR